MINRKIFFILILGLVFFYSYTNSQPKIRIILPQPPPGQMGVGDLWNLELTNITKENVKIYLKGTATEEKDGLIIEGTSKVFTVKPGTTKYKYSDFSNAEVKYNNGKYKEIIIRTGNAPDGNYTLCVTAFEETGDIAGQENCIIQSVKQLGSISLISPEDGAEINPEQPLIFTWTPLPKGGTYTLRIVELKGSQSPDDAFRSNQPIFEKELRTTTYQGDPVHGVDVKPGMKYAWQVSGGDVKSEVITFIIKQPDNQKADTIQNPHIFRLISNAGQREIGFYSSVYGYLYRQKSNDEVFLAIASRFSDNGRLLSDFGKKYTPIANADIILSSTNNSTINTITDSKGYFTFENLVKADYDLSVKSSFIKDASPYTLKIKYSETEFLINSVVLTSGEVLNNLSISKVKDTSITLTKGKIYVELTKEKNYLFYNNKIIIRNSDFHLMAEQLPPRIGVSLQRRPHGEINYSNRNGNRLEFIKVENGSYNCIIETDEEKVRFILNAEKDQQDNYIIFSDKTVKEVLRFSGTTLEINR